MTKEAGFNFESVLKFINRLIKDDSTPNNGHKRRKPVRVCRIEELESREMLSVTFGEFLEISSKYADLNLGDTQADYESYNFIEVGGADPTNTTDSFAFTDAGLRAAITEADTAMQDCLVVVRTTESQNKITLEGTELTITNEAQYGSVTIVSLGTDNLTIDANQQSRVFNISNFYTIKPTVALAGLIITNGKADSGGGIYHNGTLKVTDCTISDNTVAYWGGGIYSSGDFFSSAMLTVTNSTISNNSTTGSTASNLGGGGIYGSGENSTLTVTNSEIIGNTASSCGGGILCDYEDYILTVEGCTISNNTASIGGGIYNGVIFSSIGGSRNNSATITDSEITGNTVSSSGGGIYNSGTLTVLGSTVSDNTATDKGGGICSFGTLTVTDCIISGNSASGTHSVEGGGIWSWGALTVTSCTISNNSAIATAPYSSSGGGISCVDMATITDSEIIGNSSDIGGGINGVGHYSGTSGSGITTVTVTNCIISGNAADWGGGIYHNGTLTVMDCTITGNSADYGGGICSGGFGSTLTVNNTTVENNLVDDIYQSPMRPPGNGLVPVKAAGIKKTNISLSTVTISWKSDAKNRNTFYEVNCTSHSGVSIGDVAIVNGRHTVVVTGLSPKTSYKFSIVSYNGDTVATNKKGKVTSVTNVSVKTKAYSAPTGIKKTVTSNSITLSWKASPFVETTCYEIRNALTGALLVSVPATGTTGRVSWTYDNDGEGLSSSTTYKFEIRAVSDMLCAISDTPGIGKSLKPAKVSAKTKKV